MSAFEAVIYSIVLSAVNFIPVDPAAHQALVGKIFNWNTPPESYFHILQSSMALGILVFFRHEISSLTSSFLQVILFRRKPMTLDERMPFFILITLLPWLLVELFFKSWISDNLPDSPWLLPASLAVSGLILYFFSIRNRKQKTIVSWNWIDACILMVGPLGSFLPGVGALVLPLAIAFFRNYRPDAAMRYALYCLIPQMVVRTAIHFPSPDWGAAQPFSDLGWIPLILTFAMGLIFTMVGIQFSFKSLVERGFKGIAIYRALIAAILIAFIVLKS